MRGGGKKEGGGAQVGPFLTIFPMFLLPNRMGEETNLSARGPTGVSSPTGI